MNCWGILWSSAPNLTTRIELHSREQQIDDVFKGKGEFNSLINDSSNYDIYFLFLGQKQSRMSHGTQNMQSYAGCMTVLDTAC